MHSEALTRNGWTSYWDLHVGDEILAFDPESGECVWTPIQHLYLHPDAEVFEYGNRTFSAQCTDNHKWVTRARWKASEENYKNDPWELKPIDEWETEASLWQAAPAPDGDGLGSLNVWQMMQRKDMPAMVMRMTSHERQAFIVGVLAGEGTISSTKGNGHVCMSQNPGPVLDAFRLACALEGIATNEYNPHRNDGTRKYIKCHRVSMKQGPIRTIHNFKKKSLGNQPVWCPQTKYKTWVMKQGYTITITGNTEVTESSNNSAVMLDSFSSDLEHEFIEPILMRVWMLIIQNWDKLPADEVTEAIGMEAAFTISRMSKADRFATFCQGYSVRVYGLSTTLSRAQDFQKLMALMQAIGTNPMMMQAFMQKFSPEKALGFIYKSLNLDPENFTLTPEEQQVSMADRMSQLQKMSQITGGAQQASPTGGQESVNGQVNQSAAPSGGPL